MAPSTNKYIYKEWQSNTLTAIHSQVVLISLEVHKGILIISIFIFFKI